MSTTLIHFIAVSGTVVMAKTWNNTPIYLTFSILCQEQLGFEFYVYEEEMIKDNFLTYNYYD